MFHAKHETFRFNFLLFCGNYQSFSWSIRLTVGNSFRYRADGSFRAHPMDQRHSGDSLKSFPTLPPPTLVGMIDPSALHSYHRGRRKGGRVAGRRVDRYDRGKTSFSPSSSKEREIQRVGDQQQTNKVLPPTTGE